MQLPAPLAVPLGLTGLVLAVSALVYVLDESRSIIVGTLIVAVVVGVLDWLFSRPRRPK